MEIKDYNYILTIDKYGNMTKASEELHVSQSTLSKALKNVEDSFGVKIFNRAGHKMVPTYAGEMYLMFAKKIVKANKELNDVISDINNNHVGSIKIGLPSMRATYVLPYLLPKMKELHPNIKVIVVEGNSEHLDELLIKGEIDVAFYTFDKRMKNDAFEYRALDEEELLFVSKNKISDNKELSLNELKNLNIVLQTIGQRTRGIVDNLLLNNKATLENIIEVGSVNTVLAVIESGYAAGFVFSSHLDTKRTDLNFYTIKDKKVVREFVCASRKDLYHSKYLEDLIRIVKENKNKK